VLTALTSEAAGYSCMKEDAWQAVLTIIVASCNAFYLNLRLTTFLSD